MGKKAKPDWDHLTQEDLKKLEIAEELGLLDKIREGGYRCLSAKESGRIGGIIASQKKKKSVEEQV
ncbi:MAG: hypothetical protein IJ468_14670 [Lachnospiraceae bacterium]|nr:hypothetical protein [Lachnospiraceae bacterium]